MKHFTLLVPSKAPHCLRARAQRGFEHPQLAISLNLSETFPRDQDCGGRKYKREWPRISLGYRMPEEFPRNERGKRPWKHGDFVTLKNGARFPVSHSLLQQCIYERCCHQFRCRSTKRVEPVGRSRCDPQELDNYLSEELSAFCPRTHSAMVCQSGSSCDANCLPPGW